jgi:hypothetical protein
MGLSCRRCSGKCRACVYLGDAGLLVLPTEQQVIGFLPSVGNLAFQLFDRGAGALPLSGTVGSAGPLCTLEGRPPASFRVEDCHLVEELGFHLLNRGDLTLLQAGVVGSAGPLSTLGMQTFWCCPLGSRLQLSSPQWEILCSHSLTEKQGLFCG